MFFNALKMPTTVYFLVWDFVKRKSKHVNAGLHHFKLSQRITPIKTNKYCTLYKTLHTNHTKIEKYDSYYMKCCANKRAGQWLELISQEVQLSCEWGVVIACGGGGGCEGHLSERWTAANCLMTPFTLASIRQLIIHWFNHNWINRFSLHLVD